MSEEALKAEHREFLDDLAPLTVRVLTFGLVACFKCMDVARGLIKKITR